MLSAIIILRSADGAISITGWGLVIVFVAAVLAGK